MTIFERERFINEQGLLFVSTEILQLFYLAARLTENKKKPKIHALPKNQSSIGSSHSETGLLPAFDHVQP